MCDCIRDCIRRFCKAKYTEKNTIVINDYKKSFGECSICLEDMKLNLEALPCGHLFHKKCIQTWSNKKKVCPICTTIF